MSDPAYDDYVNPSYLRYIEDDHLDEPPCVPASYQSGLPGGVHLCGADAATSLDPPQSTVIPHRLEPTNNPLDRPDTAFRFRRADHLHAFTRTLEALRVPLRHQKRARRLALCGAHATVWHSPGTDTVCIRAYHCGLRCCPRCREMHAARTHDTLARFLACVPRNRLSMITLTLQSSDQTLTEQLDHLYASFRRLRASPLWKQAKPRGYAVLEMTWSDERQQWHPHLHLLAETAYIPYRQLSLAWQQASRGSTIVDVRRVNRKAIKQMQHYLADYLTKPPTTSILDSLPRLTEWIDGLTHRKVLLRFGKPTLAEQQPPTAQPNDWCLVGSLSHIITGAAAHYQRAVYWLSRLVDRKAHEARDPDAGKDYSLDRATRTISQPFL